MIRKIMYSIERDGERGREVVTWPLGFMLHASGSSDVGEMRKRLAELDDPTAILLRTTSYEDLVEDVTKD